MLAIPAAMCIFIYSCFMELYSCYWGLRLPAIPAWPPFSWPNANIIARYRHLKRCNLVRRFSWIREVHKNLNCSMLDCKVKQSRLSLSLSLCGVCVCVVGDNGWLQYLRFCLFEMYVNVVFVIRCLYSAVSLTLVREQRFIRIIYYYYCYYYYY